jgi:hypothetical protein
MKFKKHDMESEGSPAHEGAESKDFESKEPPSDAELDMHYKTLMDAEAVKGNPHIMKHLTPHMEKKMGHMKKITNLDQLKEHVKQKRMEK